MSDIKAISIAEVDKGMSGIRRWVFWIIAVVAPLILPLIFDSSYAISMMSQMGIAIIFALSYNMLLGNSGLLSFGHAVYFGLGGYFVIHALNAIDAGKFYFPVTFLPLLGGLGGLIFGISFGYVSTKRAGVTFAMISMGIGELMFAASSVLPIFGGEAGVSSNRVTGTGLFGINYGPPIQIYYLIAGWAMVSALLIYALSLTPLGRMVNAVRDNPERAEFVGYNPQRVRFIILALSSIFAGIAGGLAAINYEIVSQEYLSANQSAMPLLMTYIGGTMHFFGPVLGAILVTFLQVVVGVYTKAWPLYMGIVFMIMVLFAPQGLAGLIMQHQPILRAGLGARLIPSYLYAMVSGLIMLLGIISLVEFIYHLSTEIHSGTEMTLFGISFDIASSFPWVITILLIAVGFFFFRRACSAISSSWNSALAEIKGSESHE